MDVGFACKIKILVEYNNVLISRGEVVSVFTSPYLSARAPAFGEVKGLKINKNLI